MEYRDFSKIFNKSIFEKSKIDLLNRIALSPKRFVGLFRPTKPHAKILQNLSQSHEIKFGDAFEEVMRKYLSEIGFENLSRELIIEGKIKNLDLHFRKGNTTYFVEQKIRDDHDSTKKRGQLDDFTRKLQAISAKCKPKQQVRGVIFFVDEGMTKNKKFYQESIPEINKKIPGVEFHVVYGREFFEILERPDVWDEIIKHLERWKKELPNVPEINFDENSKKTFSEIKDIEVGNLRKIFKNDEIVENIIPVLFPTGETLRLLSAHFKHSCPEIFQLINKKIK